MLLMKFGKLFKKILNKTILKNQKGVRYTIKHVKGHQFCYAKDYIKPN